MAVAHQYLVDFKEKRKKMKPFGRIEKLCTLFSTALNTVVFRPVKSADPEPDCETSGGRLPAYLRGKKHGMYKSRSYFLFRY
jgi:hypothetical protein